MTAKDIRFTTTAEENNLVPPNFVHKTDPVAGTLILQDQIVEVFYNPDTQLVPIPNVVGLSLEEARTQLAADGFVVGTVTTEERDDVAEDTVISSDPLAGDPDAAGFGGQPGRVGSAVECAGARRGDRHERGRRPRASSKHLHSSSSSPPMSGRAPPCPRTP